MFFRPRWILSHLFAFTLVAAFIAAGLWQIDRLGVRQEENAVIASRMDVPVLLETLLDSDPDTLEYRRLQVAGEYDTSSEILIGNRTDEGTPGFWIWTNFKTERGDLIVNRGFVPRGVILETSGSAPRSTAAATDAPLTIEGLIRRGLNDGRVSDDGTQLIRPDATKAAELLGLDPILDPIYYLELDAQEPARSAAIPSPVPPPDLGEGPHRSYAFQWFTFATIGIIGYALVLLRIARGDQSRGDIPI